MQLEIDNRAGKVLGGGEALIETGRTLEFVDQLRRHRFAGLDMACMALQHLRLQRPVFKQL